VELKGLPAPRPACRVVWEPLVSPRGDADAGALPGALVGGASTGYVGRPELLAQLTASWRASLSGGCRTILLAGEPGVGKTRTAAVLARTAYAARAVGLYGRPVQDLGLPYQPFAP